ncbi:MAG: prepilin-type N-terminal cleavage/methylation domain-containing protein [Candidatus Aminicenantales bacterium]
MSLQRKKGFSLLELLISIFLFSLVLISTAQVIVSSFLVNKEAEFILRLTDAASFTLEQLKALYHQGHDLEQSSSLLKEIMDGEKFKRIYELKNVSPYLERVELKLFSEDSPQKKLKVALLFLKEGRF